MHITRDRTRQRISTGSIDKGEEVSLHVFDPDSDLEVTIRMEGFMWSAPVVVNIDVIDSTEMKDEAKRPLRINVRAQTSEIGTAVNSA